MLKVELNCVQYNLRTKFFKKNSTPELEVELSLNSNYSGMELIYMHHANGYRIRYRRVIRNMVALRKKNRDGVLALGQINGFTCRTVTHMDMSLIMSDRLAQVCRDVRINEQMMMPLTRVYAIFSWFYGVPIGCHTNL